MTGFCSLLAYPMTSEDVTKWLGIAMFALCFGSFFWGIHCFFRSQGSMPGRMRLTQGLGLLMAVWHVACLLTSRSPVVGLRLIGLAFYLVSLFLFWWSVHTFKKVPPTLAFSADVPERIMTNGPYRFVRHPFCTAYILAWVAGVFASGDWSLAVSVAVMTFLYLQSARMEEKKFSESKLAADYTGYRKSTGMFLPK